MSQPLPEKPNTFARLNSRGLIEVLDLESGRVLCVQASAEDLLQAKWERLTRIDTPEGPVFIEKGLNPDLALGVRGTPYSQILGDLICQMVVNGQTLVRACKELNLEYSAVVRWRRDSPEFKAQLEEAKKDRAEFLHDEMLERARHHRTSARTHVETLQYAMEKGNPEKYDQKPQNQGIPQGGITFILSTGIDRTGGPPEQIKDVTSVVPTAVAPDEIVIPEITGGS